MALQVAITREATKMLAVLLALVASVRGVQPMMIDVQVVNSPLDFDLKGSNLQTIPDFPEADPAPILFRLVPKGERRKTIVTD